MNFNIQHLKHFLLPIAFFFVTSFVAMFAQQSRDWLLPVMFLLLPFADFLWRIPRMLHGMRSQISWAIIVLVTIVLLFNNQDVSVTFTTMVLVAALPEEWFFRAYLQKRLGNNLSAVLVVSLMFTLMHFIVRSSDAAWLVFIPSIFFGWVYKKTGDLVLVVMLHALSNLVYYIYLESHIVAFFA